MTTNKRARTPPPKTPKGIRFGGRQAGTPNKKDALARFDLLQTLRAKGFDPAAKLVEAAIEAEENYLATKKENLSRGRERGQSSALEIMIRANESLMQYVYPKLRAVEHTGKDGEDLFQTFTGMVKSIAERTK